jgi:hypothetical protein
MGEMTLDQKIQIWNAAGTWFAGFATLAAVIVALKLAQRAESVRVTIRAGIQQVVAGDGSPFEDDVAISVTNIGERPVTVNSVGWAVGKGKKRKFCIQPLHGPYTHQYPIELAHGKSANLMVQLRIVPSWFADMANGFIGDLDIRTFVGQVHTSVGKTLDVKPMANLLDRIKQARTTVQAEQAQSR